MVAWADMRNRNGREEGAAGAGNANAIYHRGFRRVSQIPRTFL